MSRHFTTLIAAVAMLGFVGAASVHAQPAPKNAPQADQNRNTDPMGKKDKKKADKKTKADKKSAVPKGKNPPQADDNTEADPAGKKKN